MPRVPLLNVGAGPQPERLPTPYASPQASPDAFGAGIGEAISGPAAQLAEGARNRAEDSAVLDAYGKAKSALQARILDPEKGYASLNGQDALKARDDVLQKYGQDIDAAAQGLSTPGGKARFEHLAQTLKDEGFRSVIQHERVQIEHLQEGSFRGAVDATSRALQSPLVIGDPALIGKQLVDMEGIARTRAKQLYGENAPPEAVQSVVGPAMQKGAIEAMNGALATENPGIVTSTFGQVGKYLGEHEHVYGSIARNLVTKKQISDGASAVLTQGLTPVLLPDGTKIVRPDPSKISQGIANLAPDDPQRDQKVDAIRKRETDYTAAWNASASQVYTNALTAGTDTATGKFDISKVSEAAKEWLRQNAPEKLGALRTQDAKAQRQASGEDRQISQGWRSVVSASMNDPAQWAASYSKMTPDQFLDYVTANKQFNGEILSPDVISLQKEFTSLRKAGDKLEEPVGRTVKDEIREAFGANETGRKRFEAKWFGPILDKANAYVAGEKAGGRKVDTEAVRKFIGSQMVKVPSGHWYTSDKRVIELDPQSVLTAPPTAAATPVQTGRVPVRNPQGKSFSIPAEQLDAFLASPEGKGFTK